MTEDTYDLLVIGGGPAGLTAALYAHRGGLRVGMIGGDRPGGQVMSHHRVENYPGFPGGVPGAQLMMGWLKQVMDEVGALPVPETIVRVDFASPVKTAFTAAGEYKAHAVIVASGSRPKRLDLPGAVDFEGKGVFYCASCDGPLLRTMQDRRAAVVGGGDTAFHTAISLIPHAEWVTLITRGPAPRAQPVLVNRLLCCEGARVLVCHAVRSIIGDACLTGLILKDTETGQETVLNVGALFVGIGQDPATEFLQGAVELDAEGFIVTDALLRTSAPGVFAAGDVRVTPLRQIVTAAADGALAANSAIRYLEGRQHEVPSGNSASRPG
ncbi:MAG: FAD-dependent oxidoreductase [Thermodesulfobacteriota bacterium]